MADVDSLCDSMMVWVTTFTVPALHRHIQDITDGVALAQILNQIDPDYFSEPWLSRISTDVGDNYRLKTNNLKKVLNRMMEYFREVAGNNIVGLELPDIVAISERTDKQNISRFLQLMLGVAVNCDRKQEYIEDIMQLDEEVQHVVMTSIQELMSHYQPCTDDDSMDLSHQVQLLRQQLADAIGDKEEMAQRCHELDTQVALLHEEKSNIQLENDQLQDRLSSTDNFEDPASPASVRRTQMLAQIEELQEETYKLESNRDDYKLRCEVLEKELMDLQSKTEDLSSLADESRMLKDEIDYLRSASDKAARLEASVEIYKNKLKELGNLRSQVKRLEDKNTAFMEQTLTLEEELRKANAARAQLDSYKRQVLDLHSKVSEETRRADKAEFEVKTKAEKIDNLTRETKRLVVERDSLKEINDELQISSHGGSIKQEGVLLGEGDHEFALTPHELKEKLIRLQHENKMLKLQQSDSSDERIVTLASTLEVSQARTNELETENRISNQRLLELDQQVKDLQHEMQDKGAQSEDNAALRRKLEEHLKQLHEREEELKKKKTYIEEMEPQVSSGERQVMEMRELLKKKDEDMKNMEERYKKYLEKAKTVIRNLDPNKNQQQVGGQVDKLRAQIHEKDKLMKQMEKENEKTRHTREQEEKLIVNAWYNMGMKLHRKAVDERLSHTSPGQSFLARQRQATAARRSHPGTATSYLLTTQ